MCFTDRCLPHGSHLVDTQICGVGLDEDGTGTLLEGTV